MMPSVAAFQRQDARGCADQTTGDAQADASLRGRNEPSGIRLPTWSGGEDTCIQDLSSPALKNQPASGPKVGERFGRFTLTEELGRGYSSVVFRAHHEMLRIDVALKILLDRELDEEALKYVYREAHLLATLNHPRIIRLLDFDRLSGYHVLVLEYIDGQSMREVIARDGRIGPEATLGIVKQVVEALSYAWDRGVVHNDIKPANILLTKEGEVKVADLGMARVAQRSGHASGANQVICGTPAYVSPEMVTQGLGAADHRSDMYSLGVSMWQALAGTLPFPTTGDAMAVLMQHVNAPAPHLAEILPDLEPSLAILVSCLLAKNPADRPQSYEELLADLRVIEEAVRAEQSGDSSMSIVFAAPQQADPGKASTRGWFRSLFGGNER